MPSSICRNTARCSPLHGMMRGMSGRAVACLEFPSGLDSVIEMGKEEGAVIGKVKRMRP